MMDFTYVAMNENGKEIKGAISADNLSDAISKLKDRNLYVIEIEEGSSLNKEVKFSFSKKAGVKDLALFCRQMATLLQAGLSLLTSLNVVKEQLENKKLREAVEKLSEEVERGNAPSNVMRNFPDVFPKILINMVEAGELGGSLDKSFEKMAIQFDKDMKLRQKVVNALMYPAIVILVAIVVLNLLMIFVVPTFVGMFNDLGVELPATTKFVLNASLFMKKNWFFMLLFLVLFIFLIKYYKNTPSGKMFFATMKLKMPIMGKIALYSSIARFTRTLSTLTQTGVPLITALETTQKLLQNAFIEEKFEGVIELVRGGEGLSGPIQSIGVFPNLVSVMIRTGEESGALDDMLSKLADLYENEVENMVTRLTAIFEPLMMVFIALIVGFMLATIIMPMFKVYGSFNV